MKCWSFLPLGVLLLSVPVQAQTIVLQPTAVEFVASPDHALVKVGTTTPVVAKYELRATGMNQNGAVVLTVDLGKPTPGQDGKVTVQVPQFSALSPNLPYTAVVAAMGPDGEGVSAPSNPFARATPQIPRAPTGVRVH